MRHPLPFVGCGMSLLMACFAGGVGLMHWTGAPFYFYAGLGLGVALVVLGIRYYRRADDTRRRRIYHGLWVICVAEGAFVFGGIPGALVGGAIAGDMGEMVGWFTTAILFGTIAGRWAYVRGLPGGGFIFDD